jgi:hypothetical protein
MPELWKPDQAYIAEHFSKDTRNENKTPFPLEHHRSLEEWPFIGLQLPAEWTPSRQRNNRCLISNAPGVRLKSGSRRGGTLASRSYEIPNTEKRMLGAILNLILGPHAEPGYLVLQELVDALPDGLHGLAGAGDVQVPLGALEKQALGNRPGLDATPTAVEDLIAVRLAQKAQLTWEPNGNQ